MAASPLTTLAEQLLENAKALDAYTKATGLDAVSFDKHSLDDLPETVEERRKTVIGLAQDLKRLAQGPRDLLFETLNTFNDLANLHFIYHYNIAQYVPLDGDTSYVDLATAAGLDEILLRRFMHHAMMNRIFAESELGHAKHTAATRMLKEDPEAMDAVGFLVEELFPAAAKMVEALNKYPNSGEPNETGFNVAFNTSRPFYLELEATPERARRFGGAMRWMSHGGRFSNEHLVRGYDWAALDRPEGLMVDVGGGHGAVARAVAEATAHMRFIVQDLPSTATEGDKILPSHLRERVTFMAHDFFQEQPVKGADIYFFRYILHNWSDKYARRILASLLPALKDGARVVLYEFLPGDKATTVWTEKQPLNMDMIQALGWNSIERTSSDWKKLFSSVDSRFEFLGTRTPKGSSVSLIEAKFQLGVNGSAGD